MGILEVKSTGGKLQNEWLHVNRTQPKIQASLKRVSFIDKDTGQFVIYMPSLEISGYGETHEKAFEMLRFSMDDYFSFLIALSTKEMKKELTKLGWKQDNFKKNYSKAYVDQDGNIQNFNAVDNKVEVDLYPVEQ